MHNIAFTSRSYVADSQRSVEWNRITPVVAVVGLDDGELLYNVTRRSTLHAEFENYVIFLSRLSLHMSPVEHHVWLSPVRRGFAADRSN